MDNPEMQPAEESREDIARRVATAFQNMRESELSFQDPLNEQKHLKAMEDLHKLEGMMPGESEEERSKQANIFVQELHIRDLENK